MGFADIPDKQLLPGVGWREPLETPPPPIKKVNFTLAAVIFSSLSWALRSEFISNSRRA